MTRIPSPHRMRQPAAVALACALALLMAGCSNSRSQGTNQGATQVAAKVNKEEISVHQVNWQLQRQPGLKPEQAEAAGRQILERLIDQELAVQKAAELKLDREPAVVQAIEAARREILARAYLDRVGDSAAKPTTEEISAYYESKPGLFKQRRIYTLQELQVQGSEPQLAALREQVQKARAIHEVTDFIKTQRMPVRSSENTAPAETLPLALVESFSKMRDGQGLFLPAPGGARIVIIVATQPAPVTLEQARPAIEMAMFNERKRAGVAGDLKALRTQGRIDYQGRFAQAAASAPAPAPEPVAAAASESLDASTVNKGLAGLK